MMQAEKVSGKGRVSQMAKLTDRQKRFVEEYLIDLNATQAAIRSGYSPVTAQQIAAENLLKPVISGAIMKAMAERSRRTGITADRVIRELAKIGFANITDVVNMSEVTVEDDANRDDTAAIHSIKARHIPTENGNIVEREIKMYDKSKALEQLGRHLGIFNDKLRFEGGVQVVVHDDLEE
jgi:phage terminase small subunit